MSDPAYKKQLARAKDAARLNLREEQGLKVYDESDGNLIAIDKETRKAKVIHVCVGPIKALETSFLDRHMGMRVEFWQRPKGSKKFTISRFG